MLKVLILEQLLICKSLQLLARIWLKRLIELLVVPVFKEFSRLFVLVICLVIFPVIFFYIISNFSRFFRQIKLLFVFSTFLFIANFFDSFKLVEIILMLHSGVCQLFKTFICLINLILNDLLNLLLNNDIFFAGS
jgi:hypothetical protein